MIKKKTHQFRMGDTGSPLNARSINWCRAIKSQFFFLFLGDTTKLEMPLVNEYTDMETQLWLDQESNLSDFTQNLIIRLDCIQSHLLHTLFPDANKN